MRVYLGLGSNLGSRAVYLEKAVSLIDQMDLTQVTACSSVIETAPYGNTKQGDFLNQVIEIDTELEPEVFLDQCLNIELQLERKREEKWGPRTIDIDILFWDDKIIESSRLTIPHPDLENRLFVLAPLAELAPEKRHPLLHKTMNELKRILERKEK